MLASIKNSACDSRGYASFVNKLNSKIRCNTWDGALRMTSDIRYGSPTLAPSTNPVLQLAALAELHVRETGRLD